MTQPSIRPRIGLALGSGSARGWAHVGVLQALLSAGIVPDVVCGASVGAIVGAAYATGQLERFEAWVRGMDRRAVMSYMDFNLGGGMLKGQRLAAYMREHFDAQPIEALATRFAAVATALHTGEEVWLRSGSVSDAVRAYWLLLEKCPPGEVYNIGGERTMTVGEMLDVLIGMAGCRIRYEVDPALVRPSDVTLQIPDTSKFRAATGWEPKVPLETTLRDLLDYHRGRIRDDRAMAA